MKGFNLVTVADDNDADLPTVILQLKKVLSSSCNCKKFQQNNALGRKEGENNAVFPLNSSETNSRSMHPSPASKLARIAKLAGNKKVNSKHKWGSLVEAARAARVSRIWGGNRSKSEDSVTSDGSFGVHPSAQEDMASHYERLAKSRVEARTSVNSTEVNFVEEECKQLARAADDHSYSPSKGDVKQFRPSASAISEDRSRRLLDYSISIGETEEVNNY